jgi:DNA replication protein DnaC
MLSSTLQLDELGYLPFSQAGGAMLFHLLSKLYAKKEELLYSCSVEANLYQLTKGG